MFNYVLQHNVYFLW